MRRSILISMGMGLAMAACAAAPSSDPNASQPSSSHTFEVPGGIEDGDTVVLTKNERVYTCSKVQEAGGESRVRCADAKSDAPQGMSLHTNK